MTPQNKAILADAIMNKAASFDHPVLAVDVDDHYVTILTKTGEDGECLRYAHNYANLDLSQAPEEGWKLTLSMP